MILVGLTGGIGSGKSTVINYFKELGITCYQADDEAKKLMNSDKGLITVSYTHLTLPTKRIV